MNDPRIQELYDKKYLFEELLAACVRLIKDDLDLARYAHVNKQSDIEYEHLFKLSVNFTKLEMTYRELSSADLIKALRPGIDLMHAEISEFIENEKKKEGLE